MKNVLIIGMALIIVSLVCVVDYQHNEAIEKVAEDAKVALVESFVTPPAKPAVRPLELVIVDGDEMPGLTDRATPDTCIAYLDSNNIVHLSYAK